jgi:hypothetical protein
MIWQSLSLVRFAVDSQVIISEAEVIFQYFSMVKCDRFGQGIFRKYAYLFGVIGSTRRAARLCDIDGGYRVVAGVSVRP